MNIDNKNFLSWQWQYSNRITTVDELNEYFPLSQKEKDDINKCLSQFRMAISPYYLSLIDKDNPKDPVRAQCIPTIEETFMGPHDMIDPLNEDKMSPVKNLVHRYPDRVLFLVTDCCSMYCRHCTRRRRVGEEDKFISKENLENAIEYIKNHIEIRDVLISGGDPLTLSNKKLEEIIKAIRAIEHVEVIRIGTRVPVVMPMRIDDELLSMLRKYHPIWINTHFNHPQEITELSKKACEKIVDAGIPLGNQSVLLKGINDSIEIMKKLNLMLVKMRVRPYYLYQCDLSQGLSHFRTSVETGIDIIHALQGNISGFAVPKYVIDAPEGGGKIPIQYNYILGNDENYLYIENYEGGKYHYPIL